VLENVTVSAPSRLHFGLFSIGDTVSRKFGGVGLMIDSPRVVISAERADRFSVHSPTHPAASQAVEHAIQSWFNTFQISLRSELGASSFDELPARLVIEHLPPRHSGLGSGTQLALASAMALTKLFGKPTGNPEEMSIAVGRGKRSGIGSYGFFQGGLLVDRGKLPNESLAPLDFQTEFPDSWRIVTVIPDLPQGLSGEPELEAFRNLPDTTELEREGMVALVQEKIIPGVMQSTYELFAEGVFDFGKRSGMMFEQIQSGPYNGSTLETLIHMIRDFGVDATGQSSWGPCVFAITRNDKEANNLVEFLRTEGKINCQINIAKADNVGACVVAQSADPKPMSEPGRLS